MLSSADLIKVEYFAPRGAADRAAFLDARFSIEQIMRAPVTSRRPSTSLDEVASLIIESGVHAMPVVDDDERVIGIVTTTDIIRSLLHGPPRRGTVAAERPAAAPPQEESPEGRVYHRKPTDAGVRRRAAGSRAAARRGPRSEVPRQDAALPRPASRVPGKGAGPGRPVPGGRAGRAQPRPVAEGDPRGQARGRARDRRGARAIPARMSR